MGMPIKTGLKSTTECYPIVSIVVPLRNEEAYIGKCLESLTSQKYPSDKLEILVIDGQSEDGSAGIVKELAGSRQNIKLASNPQKTTPAARNIGVSKAAGEYIAIIDSHSRVDPNYIHETVSILESRPEVDCVGGIMQTLGTGYVGQAIALVLSSPFGVGNSKFRTSNQEQFVDTVAFPVYRRGVFGKFGLFDERLARNQDNEFNSRLKRGGGKILLTSKVKSYYFAPGNFYPFCRQAFRNGLWNIRMTGLIGAGLSARHFVPLFFVLTLLASLVAVTTGETRPLLLALGVYFSAALFFSFRAAAKKDAWPALPVLPLTFFLLHLSYGLGSLKGLTEWLVRTRAYNIDNNQQALP